MSKPLGRLALYGCAVWMFLLLLFGLSSFGTQPALAQPLHAVLLRSEPAADSVLSLPPTRVRLWFSEPVQLVEPAITVLDPRGTPVQQGAVVAQGLEISIALKTNSVGTYLVSWQVISQDTDPVSGRFIFSHGHPAGAWAGTPSSGVSASGFWLQVLARLLHALGYALAFGVLLFLRLVLDPTKLQNAQREHALNALWRLVNLGILLLLSAEAVALIAQTASLNPRSPFDLQLLGSMLSSSFGRVLAQRVGAAFILWIIVGIAQTSQSYQKALTAALLLGLLLAGIDSEASHMLTSRLPWLALLAIILHIEAMGAWVGGLVALLMLWHIQELQTFHKALRRRFGALALAAVAELALTGLVLAWLNLGSPIDLLSTPYGRILALKGLAILLPLGFAYRAQRPSGARSERWWRLEVFALLGIVILAAALLSLPPPPR